MIEQHWDGIAAYCPPDNKVSLGFVGLNNKISVFQQRAYELKDEEYLRLKVLSCRLPAFGGATVSHTNQGSPYRKLRHACQTHTARLQRTNIR